MVVVGRCVAGCERSDVIKYEVNIFNFICTYCVICKCICKVVIEFNFFLYLICTNICCYIMYRELNLYLKIFAMPPISL